MSRILIACEYSGSVREAFKARGHHAISCDLLPTDQPGEHYQGDVRDIVNQQFDAMIAFPPCTHLAVSGARWFGEKQQEQREALEFFLYLLKLPIKHIAIENPVGIASSRIRKPDQIIQPWQFGHEETKATCLWLKHLPPLKPTDIKERRDQNLTPSGQNKLGPSPDRWKLRSLTYPGIAHAIATQWGGVIEGSIPYPTQLTLF
jgi:site-specific DNA-cytosine methylase